jgi:cytochrome c
VNRVLSAGLLGIALLAAIAKPVSAGTADDVQALVRRAVEHIRLHGRQQAFADFSRPDGGFVEGDLYIFCDDADNIVLAHGGNPKLIGKNMSATRDIDGKLPVPELYRVGQTNGSGWVEYRWPNPREGTIQRKIAYVVRIDDKTVCGSGYYAPIEP